MDDEFHNVQGRAFLRLLKAQVVIDPEFIPFEVIFQFGELCSIRQAAQATRRELGLNTAQ